MEKEDLIEALATELLERKALDLILEHAEYEEFEMKPEEQEGEVATDRRPGRRRARWPSPTESAEASRPPSDGRMRAVEDASGRVGPHRPGPPFDPERRRSGRPHARPHVRRTMAAARRPAGLQRYRDYARQRQMTLGDLLLENRIIFLGSSPETGGNPAITDYLANITIQKLLFLQYENRTPGHPLLHQQPRRLVSATLAIYDTMQFIDCPIATYCMGMAASGAAILLAAAPRASGSPCRTRRS